MEHSLGLTVNQPINNSLPLLEPDDPLKYIRQNDITLQVPIVSRSYTPYQRFYHHNLLDIIVSADDTASITLDHTLFKHNKTCVSVCVYNYLKITFLPTLTCLEDLQLPLFFLLQFFSANVIT